MVPSLIAVGTYALLLAWERISLRLLYCCRARPRITLPVAMGNFLFADDFAMGAAETAGFLYGPAAGTDLLRFPPVTMASGLTAGAVKG